MITAPSASRPRHLQCARRAGFSPLGYSSCGFISQHYPRICLIYSIEADPFKLRLDRLWSRWLLHTADALSVPMFCFRVCYWFITRDTWVDMAANMVMLPIHLGLCLPSCCEYEASKASFIFGPPISGIYMDKHNVASIKGTDRTALKSA